MSQCYDNEAALTKTPTCAGYVSQITRTNFDNYAGGTDGINLTTVIDFKTLKGSTVMENPNTKKTKSFGDYSYNNLKNALATAGYIQKSSCPQGPDCHPCPPQQKVNTYLGLVITFVILTVIGWLLFILKMIKVF